MKIFKFSVIFVCVAFCIIFIFIAGMLIKQNITDLLTNDSVASMPNNVKYKDSVRAYGVPVVTQKSNSGYACIEMLSVFLKGKSSAATEEMMLEANNAGNSVSTNSSLFTELQKQFPEYKVTRHKNLKNSELLDKIYDALSKRMPVIFSYAEKKAGDNSKDTEEIWTVHYGVVVLMNIPGDRIMFNNPYGNTETYTIEDFLKATRFEIYENMEFHLKLGFAMEIYAKNAIYILEPKDDEAQIPTETQTETEAITETATETETKAVTEAETESETEAETEEYS